MGDWRRARSLPPPLWEASVVVACDPVVDAASEEAFCTMVRALLGTDGDRPLLRGSLVVAHKHQQNYCIAGYLAPCTEARPPITLTEGCCRCSFRRALEDMGVVVTDWHAPPAEFAHPFVSCWSLTAAHAAT